MIITQRQSIHWGEVGGTYMYGSNVSYYPDKSVRLYNPLMPSGEVLKTWFSSVTYRLSLLSAGFQELTFYDFSIKEIKSV